MSAPLPPDGRHGQAPLDRRSLTVESVRAVGAYTILAAEDPDGPEPAPGQFYMLACGGRWGGGPDERPYLPRAVSVMTAADGRLEFMLDAVGPGTSELCEMEPGDELLVLGPFGRGFRPVEGSRAFICAGGIGVAPMVGLQAALGHEAKVLLGFRDAAHADAAELFPGALVATDDGSVGHAGNAVELLASELRGVGNAVVYSCGPPAMLAAVRKFTLETGARAQLALESGMACGFGACFGCVVPCVDGYRRLCVDGPVLEADELASGWEAAYG